jgi:hypothetical protein
MSLSSVIPLTVAIIAAVVILAILVQVVRLRTVVPKPDTASAGDRRAAYDALTQIVLTNGTPSAETALLLRDEAKNHFDRVRAGGAAVEAKATTLLTVIAGSTGVLGLFGVSFDKPVTLTAATEGAFILGLVGIVALLYVVRPKDLPDPEGAEYISGAVTGNDNRVRLAMTFADLYTLDARIHLYATRFARSAMFIAYVAFTAAALLVFSNLSAASHSPPASPTASPTS